MILPWMQRIHNKNISDVFRRHWMAKANQAAITADLKRASAHMSDVRDMKTPMTISWKQC